MAKRMRVDEEPSNDDTNFSDEALREQLREFQVLDEIGEDSDNGRFRHLFLNIWIS